jgi:acetylornithine/succinyldiaminopimelate/putrescine aminotransferase
MGGVFRVAPPVTVSADEIKEGLRILDEAFEYVLKSHASRPKTNGLVLPAVD